MDEYQEYLRLFGELPFGMRPKFEDYQKQKASQTARNVLSSELKKGNLEKAYTEGFEKLPLMDQLLYGMAPGTGEALAAYEVPEFAKRGSKAAEEGRYLDAAGNYAISGLNLLSMIPLVGKAADVVETGAKAIKAGIKAQPAKTDYLFYDALNPLYDPFMFKAVSAVDENIADAVNKGTIDRTKKYPIPKLVKYLTKNADNQKKAQNDLNAYLTSDFKNKPSATIDELATEYNLNKPNLSEDHTFYPVSTNPETGEFIVEGLENVSSPRLANVLRKRFERNDTYPDSVENAKGYGELIINAKSNNAPSITSPYMSDNALHADIARGGNFYPNIKDRVAHVRYRVVPKEGKDVLELSEIQSDLYRFDEKLYDPYVDTWSLQKSMYDSNSNLIDAIDSAVPLDAFYTRLGNELGFKETLSNKEINSAVNRALGGLKRGTKLNETSTNSFAEPILAFNKARYDNYKGTLDNMPLAKNNQWFELALKRGIQEGHRMGVDSVQIPVNGRALLRQRGDDNIQKADSLAELYIDNTRRSIKNIEKEYGIKIKLDVDTDDFDQEFFTINLNDDTKKLTEVLKLNRGGLVNLMPLRYGN